MRRPLDSRSGGPLNEALQSTVQRLCKWPPKRPLQGPAGRDLQGPLKEALQVTVHLAGQVAAKEALQESVRRATLVVTCPASARSLARPLSRALERPSRGPRETVPLDGPSSRHLEEPLLLAPSRRPLITSRGPWLLRPDPRRGRPWEGPIPPLERRAVPERCDPIERDLEGAAVQGSFKGPCECPRKGRASPGQRGLAGGRLSGRGAVQPGAGTVYSGRIGFSICAGSSGLRFVSATKPVFSRRVQATARPAQRRVDQKAQTQQARPAG
ncbi:hypothetical protein M885DRAFT_534582 [Pelagophyceae sp. CCMP2097]|nr:hypothetical protein M885DRAFT_534582 [Pelagophyceae sp. CCMP2097]